MRKGNRTFVLILVAWFMTAVLTVVQGWGPEGWMFVVGTTTSAWIGGKGWRHWVSATKGDGS